MREAVSILDIAVPLALAISLFIGFRKSRKPWTMFAAGYFTCMALDKLIIGTVRGFTWGTQTQWMGVIAGAITAAVLVVIVKRRRKGHE